MATSKVPAKPPEKAMEDSILNLRTTAVISNILHHTLHTGVNWRLHKDSWTRLPESYRSCCYEQNSSLNRTHQACTHKLLTPCPTQLKQAQVGTTTRAAQHSERLMTTCCPPATSTRRTCDTVKASAALTPAAQAQRPELGYCLHHLPCRNHHSRRHNQLVSPPLPSSLVCLLFKTVLAMTQRQMLD
ncbi:hypothetical protein DPX16_19102 [Anabarilius grahami]|uniref:Uncharacterized protein n=1 Tax=Anabarilius grahami TaxID=495550 RepID=A0A3N0YX80_ANAGA|nr:hypothetical protein DPX16_19102 [Anabarilius grahami]